MECSGTRLLRTHVFHRASLTDAFTFSHYQPGEGQTNLTKELAIGLEKLAEFAAQEREMSMSADKSGGMSRAMPISSMDSMGRWHHGLLLRGRVRALCNRSKRYFRISSETGEVRIEERCIGVSVQET
jgi:hypothetical protein